MVRAHRPTAVGPATTGLLRPIKVRHTTIMGPDTITVRDGGTTIAPIDEKVQDEAGARERMPRDQACRLRAWWQPKRVAAPALAIEEGPSDRSGACRTTGAGRKAYVAALLKGAAAS